jgi:MoxR-like ATPase
MLVACNHDKTTVINSEYKTKYEKCIYCNPLDRYESVIPNIQLNFNNIIGYPDIKKVLQATIDNSFTGINSTHVLLEGEPSTAKSVFLETLNKNLRGYGYNSHYINAEAMTSAGVIDYLFNNNVQYLNLDEIDKLEKSHQKTFLNLLQNGILQETKFKKTRRKVMESFVCIASANYVWKILEPLVTRFLTFHLRAYTMQEYEIIARALCEFKYRKSPELALYITENVWNTYTQFRSQLPVIRNVEAVAKLSGNDKASVDMVLTALKNHSVDIEQVPRRWNK